MRHLPATGPESPRQSISGITFRQLAATRNILTKVYRYEIIAESSLILHRQPTVIPVCRPEKQHRPQPAGASVSQHTGKTPYCHNMRCTRRKLIINIVNQNHTGIQTVGLFVRTSASPRIRRLVTISIWGVSKPCRFWFDTSPANSTWRNSSSGLNANR